MKRHHTKPGKRRAFPELWVRHPLLVPGKMLLGSIAMLYEDFPHMWYSKANMKRVREQLGDRLPDTMDFITRHCDGNVEKIIVTRGAYCHDEHKHGKNELIKLAVDEFSSTWDAVVESEKVLRKRHLFMLHQKHVLLITDPTVPGVYFRLDPAVPERIYVGIAKSLHKRGHTGSPHYLWDFCATPTIDVACVIESSIHAFLNRVGEPMKDHGRGMFEVNKGDAYKLVLEYMRDHFPKYFYNMNRLGG